MSNFKNTIFAVFILFIYSSVWSINLPIPRVKAQSNWQVLESSHFEIIYDKKDLLAARENLKIAESAYKALSKFFPYSQKKKIYISMISNNDYSNGLAIVSKINRVILYMTPPASTNTSNWRETLIVHELVHIFHINSRSGYPKVLDGYLSKIIGDPAAFVFSPNNFQPKWIIEGLATYIETVHLHNARTASAYYEALMRKEVAKGIQSFASINYGGGKWPYGSAYLYGSYFFLFIEEKYGRKAIKKIVNDYSNNLVPFKFVKNSIRATGKPLDKLWLDFSAWLVNRFPNAKHNNNVPSIYKSNISLTSLAILGKSVYFVTNHGYKKSKLMLYNGVNKSRQLIKLNSGAKIDAHAKSGLLISSVSMCDSANFQSDLYISSLLGKKKRRITKCGRYYLAAWSNTGASIAALKNYGTYFGIDILSKTGKKIKTIFKGNPVDKIDLLSIDWSPLGRKLLVTRQSHRNTDIYEVDVASGGWRRLTYSNVAKGNAKYTSDGRNVIFSMVDKNRNTEIYKLSLSTLQVIKLSDNNDLILDLSAPNIYGDIYYISNYTRGLSLKSFNINSVKNKSYPRATNARTIPSKPRHHEILDNKFAVTSKKKKYKPLKHMVPSTRLPIYLNNGQFQEFGIFLFSTDVLAIHQLETSITYSPEVSNILLGMNYKYDNWLNLNLSRFISANPSSKSKKPMINNSVSMTTNRTFYSANSVSQVSLYMGTSYFNSISGTVKDEQANSSESTLGLSYTYKNYGFFAKNMSPNDGHRLAVAFENHDFLGGSTTGSTFSFSVDKFIPLGRSTLSIQFNEAVSFGGINPSKLNIGGFSSIKNVRNPLNNKNFLLRGYQSSLFSGTHARTFNISWFKTLGSIYKTTSKIPLGIGKYRVGLFTDIGKVWDDNRDIGYQVGVGVELSVELRVGFALDAPFSLSYSHGLSSYGEGMVGLSFGVSY